MDVFEKILADARQLPEVEKRRLVAAVEGEDTDAKRDTLRGFAVAAWLEHIGTSDLSGET